MRSYLGRGTYIAGLAAAMCAAVLGGTFLRVSASPSVRYQVVQKQSGYQPSTLIKAAFAACPAGTHVVGGGARVEASGPDPHGILIESDPVANGWRAAGIDTTKDRAWGVAAYAICEKP